MMGFGIINWCSFRIVDEFLFEGVVMLKFNVNWVCVIMILVIGNYWEL